MEVAAAIEDASALQLGGFRPGLLERYLAVHICYILEALCRVWGNNDNDTLRDGLDNDHSKPNVRLGMQNPVLATVYLHLSYHDLLLLFGLVPLSFTKGYVDVIHLLFLHLPNPPCSRHLLYSDLLLRSADFPDRHR